MKERWAGEELGCIMASELSLPASIETPLITAMVLDYKRRLSVCKAVL